MRGIASCVSIWGIVIGGCGSAFAPVLAQDAHKWFLGCLVRTTSTVVQKSKTGEITALGSY